MIDLIQKEEEILTGLKNFQRATVERIYHLFANHYSRVLVADEVGLGKTMVARGVIAKVARYHHESLHDKLFKVVYICSNQNIAGQNLSKLKIDQRITPESLSDTRLSMQHIKIFEDSFNESIKKNYIQLIPLTPSTSFDMKAGCGTVQERALLFSVLKRFSPLKYYLKEIEILMIDKAKKAWGWVRQYYEDRVEKCNQKSGGEYLQTMLEKVSAYFEQNPGLLTTIIEVCKLIKGQRSYDDRVNGAAKAIQLLRKMMAEISVGLINADLVIMDEFQRFPELLKAEEESETAMLANKFFNSPSSDDANVKILLLSATPYKPYSTLEEISESGNDDHYKEFMQVTNFLFEKHPEQRNQFKKVWGDYSVALSQMAIQDFAVILAKKQIAEESLYKGIARTERFIERVNNETSGNLVDKNPLEITKEDIASYIEMDAVLQAMNLTEKVPVDYVKSAPFLMSFMDHYILKQNIENHFRHDPQKINMINHPLLWINRNTISKYGALQDTNARLKKLKDEALPNGAEKLLWIPPSLPYYKFSGCYTNQNHFSKVLVFSAWEMVPRSIATLVSYEAERKTVGELVKKVPKRKRTNSHQYFAERRFPQPRVRFAMKENTPQNMNHLTLLYPSVTLAKMFNPIDALNRGITLEEIRAEIQAKLEQKLSELSIPTDSNDRRPDERWYYMAPLLLDRHEELVREWFESDSLLAESDEEETSDKDKAAIERHFEALREIFQNEAFPVLGKQPPQLLDVLTNMVLGSPGVCALRLIDEPMCNALPNVIKLAKTIIDRFNTQEAIAIVDLTYGGDNDAHWQNILKYCVDGNIQAMLDEYGHMLLEEGGLNKINAQERNKQLLLTMAKALNTHTASYDVDTYQAFKKRILSDNKKDRKMKMRTNYAVGFYDTRNEDNTLNRKENIRLAFNSPFRPFVLATTSIGQEGLDFHYYCRKVMHWNLPSNPIDLEQRDGRINRYKSHAIRQNIAGKYGNIHFEKDIWQEMFAAANQTERGADESELIPFWSLPGANEVGIKRIFPLYPLSKDVTKYNRLIKVLALYRLSLGQANQEDLIEYLLKNNIDEEHLKELFINLSPFSKEKTTTSINE